jgi:hypothetical protein
MHFGVLLAPLITDVSLIWERGSHCRYKDSKQMTLAHYLLR